MAKEIQYIEKDDVLNVGRVKINEFAIDPANRAEENSEEAIRIANEKGDLAIETATEIGNEAIRIANEKGDNAINIANEKGDKAINIAETANDKADETVKEVDRIIESIELDPNKDPEVVNARGDEASLGDRLDKVDPNTKVIQIDHNQNCYPTVNAYALNYGIGLAPLGEEPEGLFGGDNMITIPCKVEYLNRQSLVVYLSKKYAMEFHELIKDEPNEKWLIKGTQTVRLTLGGI